MCFNQKQKNDRLRFIVVSLLSYFPGVTVHSSYHSLQQNESTKKTLINKNVVFDKDIRLLLAIYKSICAGLSCTSVLPGLSQVKNFL